jgi:hypothetical protein
MRRLLITLSLLFGLASAASAQTFEEFLTQGDAALTANDYQKAENAYVDALYAQHSTEAEKPLLQKLAALYKKSGLVPLDATVKEKLSRLTKPAAKPASMFTDATTAPKSQANPGLNKSAAGAFKVVEGTLADKLLAFCKSGIEFSCKDSFKGYKGLENFQGTVQKLPSDNYQVICSCDIDSTEGKATIDVVTVVKEGANHEFNQQSLSVIPRRTTEPSPAAMAFSKWADDQRKANSEADTLAQQEVIRAREASALAEEKQIKELEEKTRQAEELSNSSNQKSKGHVAQPTAGQTQPPAQPQPEQPQP